MSKYAKQDVVSIEDARKLRHLKDKEKEFKNYLKSLKQNQLEHEIDYLLNEFDSSNNKQESILKSAMLLDELASRVDVESMSISINEFANEVRSKLDDKDLMQ